MYCGRQKPNYEEIFGEDIIESPKESCGFQKC